jgi:hypothetical protein
MGSRIASLILILIIVIGAGVLAFRFLRSSDSDNVKTLTIDSNGSFKTNEFTVKNDEVFKVKNDDDKNHTIKRKDNGETVVEVDPRSTSKELSLEDNKKVTLYLASDEKKTVEITTGTPSTQAAKKTEETKTEETKKTTPPATTPPTSNPPSSTLGTNTNHQPLPNTGPEEAYIYLILLVVGLRFGKITNKFLPR